MARFPRAVAAANICAVLDHNMHVSGSLSPVSMICFWRVLTSQRVTYKWIDDFHYYYLLQCIASNLPETNYLIWCPEYHLRSPMPFPNIVYDRRHKTNVKTNVNTNLVHSIQTYACKMSRSCNWPCRLNIATVASLPVVAKYVPEPPFCHTVYTGPGPCGASKRNNTWFNVNILGMSLVLYSDEYLNNKPCHQTCSTCASTVVSPKIG